MEQDIWSSHAIHGGTEPRHCITINHPTCRHGYLRVGFFKKWGYIGNDDVFAYCLTNFLTRKANAAPQSRTLQH